MAFACDICGKSFITAEKLRFHKVCHGQDEMKCHICDKICTGKKTFNNHIKSHQTYECPDCDQTIKMNSISHHKSKCTPKEKKSFACLITPSIKTWIVVNANTSGTTVLKNGRPNVKYRSSSWLQAFTVFD